MPLLPLIWENVSISDLFRLKNVVNVDILFTGKCKTKSSMCYSRQASADGRRLHRPGRAGSESAWHSQTLVTVTVETCEYVFNSKVKLKSDIFCVVEVLWERHIGSVMFYLLDMAHERRQACPSVVVKGKQWSISEKDHLGYGRTLIAYAGSGPPRHSTSMYDRPGGVFTIAILKNHGQPFYNVAKITQTDAFNYMSYHFLCKRGIRPARTEQFLVR